MKFIYYLVYALPIVMTLYIIPMSISFSRTFDTIEIKALLTKDDFIATSLNFQKTTLTFGEENKICPDNNCFYEFEIHHLMMDLEQKIQNFYRVH